MLKKFLSVFMIIMIMLCLCACKSTNGSESDNKNQNDIGVTNNSSILVNSDSSNQSNGQTSLSDCVTSQDVLNKVNEGASFYNFPKVSNYQENFKDNVKNFTFSYATKQYPKDTFGVIGTEDEKGISALHTIYFFSNTGFDGAVALALSYIPAISCYCPDIKLESSLDKINGAFREGEEESVENGNKMVFLSGKYEYTLSITDTTLMVSVIRKDVKAN